MKKDKEFGGDEAKELPALLQDIEDEEGGNHDRVATGSKQNK